MYPHFLHAGIMGDLMKKSLFRWFDRVELLCCYALCFLFSMLFEYFRTIPIESEFLKSYLKQFYDYQTFITLLISVLSVIFHYKMLQRRKREVHCRILVGDTISSVTLRYFCECLMMLGTVFFAAIIWNLALRLTIRYNVYLLFAFLLYILISSGMVHTFENI